MATKKIEIQDHQGNVYHPHTDANVVYMPDGKTVKEALESLKLSVSNGKSSIATAITGKGVAASGNDSFSTLSTKIGQISTGKKWASGQSKVSGRRRFDTFSGDGEYKTIDITNVGFKPNFITMVCIDRSSDEHNFTVNYANIDNIHDRVIILTSKKFYPGNGSTNGIVKLSSCILTDNHIQMPAYVNGGDIYKWYAFE